MIFVQIKITEQADSDKVLHVLCGGILLEDWPQITFSRFF